jgi:molybdate transport system permease protein
MAETAATQLLKTRHERRQEATWHRVDWRKVALLLASLPFLLFLLLPLLALVLRATPADILAHLVDPSVAQAIQLSLVTTLCTLGLTVIGGTPLAYLLARGTFPGRTILDALLDLPIVMPPAVAGIALLVAFGRFGLLGHWLNALGIDIAFTPVAVVMAQTFVAAPFYIKAASTAFANVNHDIEDAAAVDGAGPFGVFGRITLPLSIAALMGGALMTWARALGEFGATIIFAGNFPGRTQTMPLAIYLGFELDLSAAITLAIVLLVMSFAILLLVRWALRQRIQTDQ